MKNPDIVSSSLPCNYISRSTSDFLLRLGRMFRLPFSWLNRLVVAHFLQTFDHDPLPWFQSVFHHPERADPFPNLYCPDLCFVVGSNDGQLKTRLHLVYRPLRNEQCPMQRPDGYSDADELS